MRMIMTAALLAVSVATTAHEAPKGYWGDNIDSQIWRNSYGECWQTGTITKEQAQAGCEASAPAAAVPAAPRLVVTAAPAPAPAAPAPEPAAPIDTDGDGVADAKDQCPDSSAGARVDAKGCYIVLKETVTIAINVKFPTGSAQINAAGDAEIQKLVDFMTEYPQTSVEIGGHTDNVGSAAGNVRLSQARADAVRSNLITKGKIDGGRVTAKGYGPSKPVADNGTVEGRTANRRVEGVVSQEVEKVQR